MIVKRMAYIYNPHAGKGIAANCFLDIINVFSHAGYEVTIVPTQKKHHCRDYIATEGGRFETVVVSGGDGTVNEAFNGLMQIDESERPVMGYIPTGTTNDFAASCLIPQDAYQAAEIIAGDNLAQVDAGLFNDAYFAYIAAFGAFTWVAYDTPQQIKSIFGYAAYIIEGIKQLGKVRPYKMRVETPDNVYEEEFIFGMIANSHSVGGMKLKSFEVDLCDGLFEVILLKKIQKPTDINAIITDLRNKCRDSEYYYAFKTNRLSAISYEKINWTLDGEFGGEHDCVKIENIQKAVKVKVAP